MARTENEVKRAMKLLPAQRYPYAIENIVTHQLVYVLAKSENSYAISEFEGKTILAMWPGVEYAIHNAKDVWVDFTPHEIELSKLEVILDFIEEKDWLIDMFPVDGKTGSLITVEEFISDLNAFVDS